MKRIRLKKGKLEGRKQEQLSQIRKIRKWVIINYPFEVGYKKNLKMIKYLDDLEKQIKGEKK